VVNKDFHFVSSRALAVSSTYGVTTAMQGRSDGGILLDPFIPTQIKFLATPLLLCQSV